MGSAALIGGATLGSAALGYLGNESAQDASEAAYEEEQAQRNKAYNLLSQQQDYNIQGLDYTPEEYSNAANPYLYELPEDVAATQVADSPEARALQVQALTDLQARSDEGRSASEKASLARNLTSAQESAKGREGAIAESLAQRGLGGSGLQLVQQQMSAQSVADTMSQAALDEEALNAQAKQEALDSLLSGSSNLRSQDVSLNESNANILNQFALENSTRQNQIKNANIDTQNKASQSATATANANVDQRNQAYLQNQQQAIQNQQLQQQSAREKLQSQANALTGSTSSIQAQGAAQANYAAAPYQALSSALSSGTGALANYYSSANLANALKKNNQYSGDISSGNYGSYA